MQDKKRAKARIDELRKIVNATHLVCDSEDLLPFAWRTPMVVDDKKCSKVLHTLAQEEQERNAPPSAPKSNHHRRG